MINRTPGGYEAGIALKAGTAAALIADYERKAVGGRIPCLDLFDGSNHATELHDAMEAVAQEFDTDFISDRDAEFWEEYEGVGVVIGTSNFEKI